MRRHSGERAAQVLLRIPATQLGGLPHRQSRRDVSVQGVVRRRLIGQHIGDEAAADQLRQHLGAIADQADRQRPARPLRLVAPAQRFVQRRRRAVEVARVEAALDARRIHFDHQADGVVHRGGERLGAAHSAEPAAQHDAPLERSPEMALRHGAERLVRALQNSLRPDVNPRARGHLAVHDEALSLELAEHLPCRPATDQVRVGDQDAGRFGMRREHTHRLSRLHQQRLVVLERRQRPTYGVERRPVAHRLAGAAVHDELVRPLGHLRVQVVHEHPQGGLLNPTLAGALRSPRRADDSGGTHVASGSNFPARIPAATRSISAVSGRSPCRGGAAPRTAA